MNTDLIANHDTSVRSSRRVRLGGPESVNRGDLPVDDRWSAKADPTVLENLVQGRVVNQVKVDAHTRKWSMVALERMLAIKGTGNPINKVNQPVGSTID